MIHPVHQLLDYVTIVAEDLALHATTPANAREVTRDIAELVHDVDDTARATAITGLSQLARHMRLAVTAVEAAPADAVAATAEMACGALLRTVDSARPCAPPPVRAPSYPTEADAPADPDIAAA